MVGVGAWATQQGWCFRIDLVVCSGFVPCFSNSNFFIFFEMGSCVLWFGVILSKLLPCCRHSSYVLQKWSLTGSVKWKQTLFAFTFIAIVLFILSSVWIYMLCRAYYFRSDSLLDLLIVAVQMISSEFLYLIQPMIYVVSLLHNECSICLVHLTGALSSTAQFQSDSDRLDCEHRFIDNVIAGIASFGL